MDYCFCKLFVEDDYFTVVSMMSGFDCMCSLMTKVEMIGNNLEDGDYVIAKFDHETEETELELVVVFKDGCMDIIDAEDYFD